MKTLYKSASVLTLLMLSTSFAHAGDVSSIIDDGKVFGEVRYRYEHVEQSGIANKADASTIRTNLGFKTGKYQGFQALIEGQVVQNIGPNDYNDTINGKTAYPVVADPDAAEIDKLWLSYDVTGNTMIKVGRQTIALDNQRFVGGAAWRQNNQTFDAAGITTSFIPDLNIGYNYIQNVNRIQGGHSPIGDLESDTHLVNLSYSFADLLNATIYGYWMDFDNKNVVTIANLSNETYGIRLTGKMPLSDIWTFDYEAEYATQEDYGNSNLNYDEGYYHIAPSISGNGFTFKLGYEVLEGNGTTGFQTPLASAHKFNGWADKFTTTPANGLEDAYGVIGYKVNDTGTFLDNTDFKVMYHDFEGEKTGDYGSEIDLVVGKKFKLPDMQKPIALTLKYADYNADDAPYTDTEKFWFQVGFKF